MRRPAAQPDRRDAAGPAGPCSICAHAAERGWWGDISPARTHCRACHRSWASTKEAHCGTCHVHFSSATAFDAHRRRGACVDPASETRRDGNPRFASREGPFGITWRLAFHGEPPPHWTVAG